MLADRRFKVALLPAQAYGTIASGGTGSADGESGIHGPTRAEARLKAARWWASQNGKGFRKTSEVAFSVDAEPLPENVSRWTVVITYEEG
jgi:hypothetical protein